MKNNLPILLTGITVVLILALMTGCGKAMVIQPVNTASQGKPTHRPVPPPLDPKHREIWLAGGCFWGLEAYMEKLNGVVYVNVGYANGNTENPTYEQVVYEKTGHAETVYVQYDPGRIDLATLVTYFFKVVDPTTLNRETTGGSSTAAASITRIPRIRT